MTSHKLFFQKNFFYFLWFSTRCVIFSSKLSHCLVLSAISIFNDLTLVLISEPHPSHSHTPWQSFVCSQRKIEAIGTVLATTPWAGPPSLIEFHPMDNRRSPFQKITRLFCKRFFFQLTTTPTMTTCLYVETLSLTQPEDSICQRRQYRSHKYPLPPSPFLPPPWQTCDLPLLTPAVTDIWWTLLETCSNLFAWEPTTPTGTDI